LMGVEPDAPFKSLVVPDVPLMEEVL
jgi:hypothetical protein